MAARRTTSRHLLGGAFTTFTISAGLMHPYAVFLMAFLEDFRKDLAQIDVIPVVTSAQAVEALAPQL